VAEHIRNRAVVHLEIKSGNMGIADRLCLMLSSKSLLYGIKEHKWTIGVQKYVGA
jgi:hypothetical protein